MVRIDRITLFATVLTLLDLALFFSAISYWSVGPHTKSREVNDMIIGKKTPLFRKQNSATNELGA